MRVMTPILVASSLMLSACGTPQEQCINRATREGHTIDRLIAETRDNLQRGYGFEPEIRTRWSWEICDRFLDSAGQMRTRMCWEPVRETVQRPIAIDPQAEERKLAGLMTRREAYLQSTAPAVAACRATYPE